MVTQILAVLRELATLRRSLDRLEYENVMLVRAAGATWEQIGDELGISRQAAARRFAQPRRRRPDGPESAA